MMIKTSANLMVIEWIESILSIGSMLNEYLACE